MNKHPLVTIRRTGLLLTAVLLFLPAMRAQEWTQTEFLIGTYYDPPVQGMESEEEIAEQYRRARDAGFNLLTNRRVTHGYGTVREAKLQEYARRHGFKLLKKDDYLSRTPAKTITRDVAAKRLATKRRQGTQEDFYGYDLIDEPRNEEDKARIRNVIAAAREECPDKPFLVNLLPSYGFSSWEEFRSYAESYASADMGLQLLCFDNYFPQSQFQNPPTTRYSYFSDLSLLRRLAGDRPLWSYIFTRLYVKRMAEPQQRAFMWLSAFAPLAYGAKGLLYFTYDRFEAHEVRRNLNYHAQPAWNQPVYFQAGGEPFQTFVCQLRDNAAGFADIATYTPRDGGTWYVKYAKEDRAETTRSTDRTLHGAGTDVAPLTGDLNTDGTDELLTITRAGTLNVLHHDGGTAQAVRLETFPGLPETQGTIVCDVDGNRRAELLLQSGLTTHIYWDYDTRSNTFARKTEQNLPAKALQLLAADGTTYALSENALYQTDKKGRWKEVRTLTFAPKAGKPDHGWMEGGLLFVQDKAGKIWHETKADGQLTEQLTRYAEDYLYKFARRNPKTGAFDLYGVMMPNYEYSGLLDTDGQPTPTYTYAAEANKFVLNALAPIVFSEEWLGAYHASVTANEYADAIDVVGAKTPLLRQIPEEVVAGVFRKDSKTYHVLVVNKTDRTLPSPTLTLRASSARLVARPDGGSMAADTRTAGRQLAVTVPQLRGGECAVLEVKTK